MAILLADSFSYLGRKPLDSRLVFDTIADMVAMAESTLYDGIIAYNKEDSKYYTFDRTRTADPTLGKWEELKVGSTNNGATIKEYSQGTDYTKDTLIIKDGKLYIVTADFTSDNTEANVNDSFELDLLAGNLAAVDFDTDKYMVVAPETYSFEIFSAGTGYAVNEVIVTTGEEVVNVKITQVDTNGEILQVEKTEEDASGSAVGTGASVYASKNMYVGAGKEWIPFPEIEANDSALTKNITSNVEVGGAAVGTLFAEGTSLTEALEKILRKAIIPAITFTITNGGLHEQGTTVTGSNLKVIINNLSQVTSTIKNIVFKANGTVLATEPFVAGTSTYTADYTTAMTADTTFEVVVTYDETKEVKGTSKIQFVYPSFFGSVETLTPDATTVSGLSKIIKNSKAYTADNVNLTDARFCYAYPATLGNLTTIKDANNFEYLGSYTKTALTINSVNYNLYVLTDPVTITGAKQIYA